MFDEPQFLSLQGVSFSHTNWSLRTNTNSHWCNLNAPKQHHMCTPTHIQSHEQLILCDESNLQHLCSQLNVFSRLVRLFSPPLPPQRTSSSLSINGNVSQPMAGRPLKSHEGLKDTHTQRSYIVKHRKHTLSLIMHILYVANEFLISALTSLPHASCIFHSSYAHTYNLTPTRI